MTINKFFLLFFVFTISSAIVSASFCNNYTTTPGGYACWDFENNSLADWDTSGLSIISDGNEIDGAFSLKGGNSNPFDYGHSPTMGVISDLKFTVTFNVSLNIPTGFYSRFGVGTNTSTGFWFFLDGTQGEFCTLYSGDQLCYQDGDETLYTNYDYDEVKKIRINVYDYLGVARANLYINDILIKQGWKEYGNDDPVEALNFSLVYYSYNAVEYFDDILVLNSSILAVYNLKVRDEVTGQLLKEDVNLQLRNATNEYNYMLSGGSISSTLIENGLFDIKLYSQNYPTRYYFNVNISDSDEYDFYMLDNTEGHEVIFSIKDKGTDTAIQDVLVNTSLFMNSSYTLVEQRRSDALGHAHNWLQDDQYYNITLEKNGYTKRNIRIEPDASAYIILLDPGVNYSWTNIWDDISYNISPDPSINYLEPNDAQVFNVTIYSKNGLLTYFGIKGPGNISNISGKPYGGNASITINTSNSSAFNIKVFFDATSYSPFEENLTFGFFKPPRYNTSKRNLLNATKEAGKQMTTLTKGLLGIVGVLMAVGTVAEFGVFGVGLVIVGAITFGFFAIVGWFDPIYVALALFVGLGMVFFARRE